MMKTNSNRTINTYAMNECVVVLEELYGCFPSTESDPLGMCMRCVLGMVDESTCEGFSGAGQTCVEGTCADAYSLDEGCATSMGEFWAACSPCEDYNEDGEPSEEGNSKEDLSMPTELVDTQPFEILAIA